MKVITTEKDYDAIATGVEKILNKVKALPENVFNQTFKFFLFITFDELFIPQLFLNHLKQYLLK